MIFSLARWSRREWMLGLWRRALGVRSFEDLMQSFGRYVAELRRLSLTLIDAALVSRR
jgi:hypothetical protein